MFSKLNHLEKILKKLGRVLVAYSGGVDSAFLLLAAIKFLGRENVFAVIAESETYPRAEKKSAVSLAKKLRVKYQVILTEELKNKNFADNPVERCFWCKNELFAKLTVLADQKKMVVVDGLNYSDRGDFRPGVKAAAKWNVLHPLQQAKLTKEEIRFWSREWDLPTWDKPAQACLASRFPYGQPITGESLGRIERAEKNLSKLGFKIIRVRHYGSTARIEVGKNELIKIIKDDIREKIISSFKKLGYQYVTLDLAGYRTGSMNVSLKA
ncbi:MAG: ATP-dependent sacrificial sulfur transferase LarE [Elusimicrobiota bacterium]